MAHRRRTFAELSSEQATRLLIIRRIGWLRTLLLLVLIALTGRLVDLQIVQAPRLRALARRQAAQILTITAVRGQIYDRRGRLLAINIRARSVYADPGLVTDPASAASQLAPLLALDPHDVHRRLTSPGRFVWIARRIESVPARVIAQLRLPGIGLVDEDRRVYPMRALAGRVLGFTGAENQGLAGIELAYESVLAGRSGRVQIVTDALGRELVDTRRVLSPTRPGRNLVLTIDAVIQHIAEREIASAVRASRARRGIAIVMDPATSEVLAMVAIPGFDPTVPDFRRPEGWRNPAVSDVYEPGSTLKAVVAAVALESGALRPNDTFYDPGYLRVGATTIRDAETRPGGHGLQTLSDIITNSCNVGAALVGTRVGKSRMAGSLRRFGFGEPTGIDLPGEAAGLIRPIEAWYGPTLQTISFGQGISVTPIQLLAAVSAIANGGALVRPHVVRSVRDVFGASEPAPTTPARRVVRPEVARTVTAMLKRAVDEGTGTGAALQAYDVAGKTGTAQKPGPG
ncbi:MAG: peptidoglycan D,D-transpeptidase FtsI family protein, partial [bacterium]